MDVGAQAVGDGAAVMALQKIKHILLSSPSPTALHRGLPAIDFEDVLLVAAVRLKLVRLRPK